MNLLRAVITLIVASSTPALAFDFSSAFALTSSGALTAPTTSSFTNASISVQGATNPDWVFGDLEAGFAGRQVATRLLLWSIPWAGAGIVGLWLAGDDWQKGFWGMNGAWAIINSGIALAGLLGAEPALSDLRTILLVNAGLDVLYMAGGVYLMTRGEATWRGAGLAVLIQGGFLLVFDLLHALLI
jgi:hypothetical protein